MRTRKNRNSGGIRQWFRGRRKDPLLEVETTTAPERRLWRTLAVVIPLLLVVLVGTIWWVGVTAGRVLFTHNPRFALRHLRIQASGPMITEAHVRDYLGIAEGTNLFWVDIAALREEFLRKTPSVKSMTINRRLPDTLEIQLSERVAVARVGRFKPLGIDPDGYVYHLRSPSRELPMIDGAYDANLRPGMQAGGMFRCALQVIEACRKGPYNPALRVESIDIANGEYLDLRLANGERVRLAWEHMNENSDPSNRRLNAKLEQLSAVLRTTAGRGKRVAMADLTFNEDYVPVQEY
jgi:hypothetical protein